MNRLMHRFLWVALGLHLAGLLGTGMAQDQVPAKPSGTRLTTADLKQLYSSDTTVEFRTPAGATGTRTFRTDGTAEIQYKFPNGNSSSSPGTWRLQEDRLCVVWQRFLDGKELCFEHYEAGPNRYDSWEAWSGKLNNTYSFRK
jgi:hypothetical protein